MDDPRIDVQPDGPYLVSGGVPLASKRMVTSEAGESLTWQTGGVDPQEGRYALCRCGGSANKPFCDGTHKDGFDGTETAPTDTYAERSETYEGTGMELLDDRGICSHAGFCGAGASNTWKMMPDTDDVDVRSRAMAMVERCPSGALTYTVDGEQVEPDLPAQVSVVDDGPLWVTGGIPVGRSDGEPLETRNRVVLCRCGASGNKPLCDGSHAEMDWDG